MADRKLILGYATPGRWQACESVTMAPDAFGPERDPALIEPVAQAVVFLTVDWSPQDRVVRNVLREALGAMPADVKFEFFVLEQDDPRSAAWLLNHGWPYRDPLGYGSVLWFERGALVARETFPHRRGAKAENPIRVLATPKIPVAVYRGILSLVGVDVPCYVLDNGVHLVSRTAFIEVITGIKEGGGFKKYLTVAPLRPFINADAVDERAR
jgi:hypothetical protein